MTRSSAPVRLTDRKRAAIVQAAAREFQSRGFDATSMDTIAEAAQVSKRTVYNHFASKEALFAAIVEDLVSRSDRTNEYPYDASRTLEDQLTAIGKSVIALLASDDFQNLARVILSRFLQVPELARKMTGESRRPDAGIAEWIEAARQDGRLEVKNPQHAAKQFFGLLNSFAFWPQIVGSEAPLSKREQTAVVKSAVTMFLRCYAP